MSAIFAVTMPLGPNSPCTVTDRVKAATVAEASLEAYNAMKRDYPRSSVQWPTSVRIVEVWA